MSADTAQVLRVAAADLETNGWCQGTLYVVDQGSCLIGSIRRATGLMDNDYLPANHPVWGNTHMALSAVSRHLGVRFLGTWNDEPGRTQAEVVKALLTAADLEDVAEPVAGQ